MSDIDADRGKRRRPKAAARRKSQGKALRWWWVVRGLLILAPKIAQNIEWILRWLDRLNGS